MSKSNRVLVNTITKEYIDVLMKNNAPTSITTIINGLPTDTVNELNNFNDEMCVKVVARSMLKLTYDPKIEKTMSTEILMKYFME